MTSNHINQQTPPIILGSGYTGKVLCRIWNQSFQPFLASSRDPETHLAHLAPHQRLCFNLNRQETWDNFPKQGPIIWCFPATPLELVQNFSQRCLSSSRRLIVLGSTSAYDMSGSMREKDSPPWIEETHPVKLEIPRVAGEEFLRSQLGATVLRVSGIYGPDRNVLKWIREGRVASSKKYVNLIHVEDLAGICLAALERGSSGAIYNVSDGTPRQWKEICTEASRRWNIPIQQECEDVELGKRISIEKLRRELNYSFRHPNLYDALEQLEK